MENLQFPALNFGACSSTFAPVTRNAQEVDQLLLHNTDSKLASTDQLDEADEEQPADSKQEVDPENDIFVPEVVSQTYFDNEHFTITNSQTAGLGAFANRHLRRGDIILTERPLFIADFQSVFSEFSKLADHEKEVVLSLHANELLKPGTSLVYAIWKTNWYALPPCMTTTTSQPNTPTWTF
jgi:hypothetical protein